MAPPSLVSQLANIRDDVIHRWAWGEGKGKHRYITGYFLFFKSSFQTYYINWWLFIGCARFRQVLSLRKVYMKSRNPEAKYLKFSWWPGLIKIRAFNNLICIYPWGLPCPLNSENGILPPPLKFFAVPSPWRDFLTSKTSFFWNFGKIFFASRRF